MARACAFVGAEFPLACLTSADRRSEIGDRGRTVADASEKRTETSATAHRFELAAWNGLRGRHVPPGVLGAPAVAIQVERTNHIRAGTMGFIGPSPRPSNAIEEFLVSGEGSVHGDQQKTTRAATHSRLSDENRHRIAQLVRMQPGIRVAEASKQLDLAWTTVRYHLRIMARHGLVKVQRNGNHVRAFPPELAADALALITLRNNEARRLLTTIASNPNQTPISLQAQLQASKKTVRTQLAKLLRAGLVRREGTLRPRYHIMPEAYAALSRANPH